jgi:hypothetical protein
MMGKATMSPMDKKKTLGFLDVFLSFPFFFPFFFQLPEYSFFGTQKEKEKEKN